MRFNTEKDQKHNGGGGERTLIFAGRCARCQSRVYKWKEDGHPDPRGPVPTQHCLATLDESDVQSAAAARVPFCYRCLWDSGGVGYKACRAIALKSA